MDFWPPNTCGHINTHTPTHKDYVRKIHSIAVPIFLKIYLCYLSV